MVEALTSRPRRFGILSIGVTALVAGLLGAQAAAVPAAKVDWSTFGFDVLRTSNNPNETAIGVGNANQLHQLWSHPVGGFVFGPPTMAVAAGPAGEDLLYVGSESGAFTALNAATGNQVWQRNLHAGTSGSCAGMGVSGSSAVDRANHALYVVGGDNKAYALDLATGAIATGWPITLSTNANEHAWSAVTLSNGILYTELAGCADIPPYHGQIIAIKVSTRQMKKWYVTGQSGPSGGGIWAWGGVSVDPATHDVYTATGNALANPEHVGFAENVVRLSAGLMVKAANYPGLNGVDVDFGSTPVLYHAPGCPTQLAVENKDGVLFVYNRDTITPGPVQSIAMADPNLDHGSFIGHPAYSPVTNTLYVANSSDSPGGTYTHGIVALKVQPDCTLALSWQQARGANANVIPPPVVANGVVYLADGRNPKLYAFDATTGQELWNSLTMTPRGFSAGPIVVNGVLYVTENDGTVHAFGP
jgi:outer membrane protein assembly factor BamB